MQSVNSRHPTEHVQPLLQVDGVSKAFGRRSIASLFTRGGSRRGRPAVDQVSFSVSAGEIVGLVGESGSGKSVTAQMIARLLDVDAGRLLFKGKDVTHLRGRALLDFRRQVQIVFQNPFDSINPRLTVEAIVAEPLAIHRVGDRRRRVLEVLRQVGLQPAEHYLPRYPHQLSGGERQRVCIARALVLGPELLIADEPTTMLDVSVRAGILNLISHLRTTMGLAVLFISHDIATIRYLCDRTVVMYLGRTVEIGPTRDLLEHRLHPYTAALAAADPDPDPETRRAAHPDDAGEIPTGGGPETGCSFAPRCPAAMARCGYHVPALQTALPHHAVACHLYGAAAPPAQSRVEAVGSN